jgi:GNAT superfamily N-acetyltransferase
MPDDFLDQLRPEDRAKRYDFGNLDPIRPQTIIAVERGEIRGFATTAPAQESNMSDFGELYGLYVDPDHWGRGMASRWCRQLVLDF